MPYKNTPLKIPEKFDKRIKLSTQDKINIKTSYDAGGVSQRALAKQYGVSRRLIVFVIYPERLAENYANRVANGGSKQYYDKDKHTIAMRTHRKHKQELYLKGELEDGR